MGNGFIKNLKFIWDCVLQVIYSDDEKCILCREELYEDKSICKKCEDTLKFCDDSFWIEKDKQKCRCYSVSYYSGIMMELILRLKYRSDFKAGEIISGYMIKLIMKKDIKCDYIAYVPMTKISLKKRGYNQSKYLAKSVSEATGIQLIHCLQKVGQTKDQIGLTGDERWQNVKNSIKFINKKDIKNKKILLVDDVVTTGATALSCVYELKRNGAEEITVLTGAKSKV